MRLISISGLYMGYVKYLKYYYTSCVKWCM